MAHRVSVCKAITPLYCVCISEHNYKYTLVVEVKQDLTGQQIKNSMEAFAVYTEHKVADAVLVATSLAVRGLNIPAVDCVRISVKMFK